MPKLVQASGITAAAAPVTNPGQPPVTAVALSDGEGNLLAFNASGALPVVQAGATSELTYPTAARSTNNAGDSFSTAAISSLAVDANVTAFTGGTSPTITFWIERFGADGLWYRIWTSAAISATGPVSASIGPGQSGTGNVAAVLTGTAHFGWTLAGAPTSITFSASVVGRP